MSSVDVKIRVDEYVNINISVEDIIDAANELPILKRWNLVAKILNEIDTPPEQALLTVEQRNIIIEFLDKKLKSFK